MRRLKSVTTSIARKFARWTPTGIQVLGMGSFAAGFFLIAIPAGLIITGLLVMAVGWALDGGN